MLDIIFRSSRYLTETYPMESVTSTASSTRPTTQHHPFKGPNMQQWIPPHDDTDKIHLYVPNSFEPLYQSLRRKWQRKNGEDRSEGRATESQARRAVISVWSAEERLKYPGIDWFAPPVEDPWSNVCTTQPCIMPQPLRSILHCSNKE